MLLLIIAGLSMGIFGLLFVTPYPEEAVLLAGGMFLVNVVLAVFAMIGGGHTPWEAFVLFTAIPAVIFVYGRMLIRRRHAARSKAEEMSVDAPEAE